MQKQERRAISRSRKILFSLVALLGIPALFLLGVEFILRIAGFGYPTSFFLKKEINGKTMLVQNDKFGLRFFPAGLVRRPLPLMISPHKPENTVRIFIFGESAAMGDPDPAFGVGRLLREVLRQRFPGTEFEVVNVAFTAINSHVILPIARECAALDGDLWVVYMGNNEMLGPFGAGTVFGEHKPALRLVRASLALKGLRLAQLIERATEGFQEKSGAKKRWEGLKMFEQVRVSPDDAARTRVYAHFQQNLADILSAAKHAGVPVVLSTVASNLRDCAPFASAHGLTGGGESAQAWSALVREAAQLQGRGDAAEALKRYVGARAIDASAAELEFRIAVCHLALGDREKARQAFERARDLDALPFRADGKLNRTVLKLAVKPKGEDGPTLVDAVGALSAVSTNQIPGNEMFYDHVHLTFEGNYQLALALAQSTWGRLPKAVLARDRGGWPSFSECAAALAWTPLSETACYEAMLSRTADAPFTNQITHVARSRYCQARIAKLNARSREVIEHAREVAAKAVGDAPDDYYLREQFAKILTIEGDTAKALAEWSRARDLLPISAEPYFELGRLQTKAGKFPEARANLARALEVQPQSAEIIGEMARLDLAQGDPAAAIERANRALALHPSAVEAWTARAQAEERLGRTNDAVQTYRLLAREKPGLPSARTSAGRLLNALGKFDEAAEEYTRLTEIQPRNAGAFMDLANALAAANRRPEATRALEKAVELKPDFWQARYLLGVELAMQKRLREAEAQFAEVIALQPNYALAHLNLGIALTQEARVSEAAEHFRETLRLDPKNAKAKQCLEIIERSQAASALAPIQ